MGAGTLVIGEFDFEIFQMTPELLILLIKKIVGASGHEKLRQNDTVFRAKLRLGV